ncbi:right-handed parallel beta-helix repeat-containing protein [Limisphaera sp. VF-2]|uniref:right-handed parallel beta-helix repeat-containing protein n=1 Tax=Limisphaera sp. VF-2 TaxID=3400418 RepID=UPI00309CC39E
MSWAGLGWVGAIGLLSGVAAGAPSEGSRIPDPGAPRPIVFYVATNGNDAWSGRQSVPLRGGEDGPFASLARAVQAVRELRAKDTAAARARAVIQVRGGTYFLPEPLVLTSVDSNLEIVAHGNEQPILSAGRRIPEWQVEVQGDRTLWIAPVPGLRESREPFRQLWINGRRAVRARHPNRGYLAVESLPDRTAQWHEGQRRIRYKAGDVPLGPTLTLAEAVVMSRWTDSHLPITEVNAAERILSFGKRSVFQMDPGDPYYLEGAREFLDAPGEWWWEAETGRLLYLPRPGETPVGSEGIIGGLPAVVEIRGRPEAGEFVERVRFAGLTFAHTEWWFPRDAEEARRLAMAWPAPSHEVGGFAQAAVGVPAAVRATGLRDSRFEGCRFVQLGTYGLELGRGCQSNRVVACEFADLGAGGIKMGETQIRTRAEEIARANEVADCHLHHGGRIFHSAVAIWIGQSPDNRILHNHVHDFYYTGISVGWTWGYDPRALATNQLVAGNHVHHIGVQSDGDGPILSDMGGIYTLGRQVGTRIVQNLWHDIAGLRYGGWGIYFDEGTAGILAESNLVYRTTHGGFHQHYGATNVVRNNIFAFARDHQLQRSREEEHISFIFTNNIVLFDQGVLLGGSWNNDRFVIDGNLYWDLRPGANWENWKFGSRSWADWRARGHDRHSLFGDPLFVGAREGDFRLAPGSPARFIGFQPLDLRGVGPRSARRTW